MTALADPVGKVLTEIRASADVTSWGQWGSADRVRPGEPKPKDASYEGDALGPGQYKRFIVVSVLGRARQRRLPVQEVRLSVRVYGLTAQDAGAGAMAVSAAIHAKGPRIGSGVGIWNSWDELGEGYEKDPDTKQPYETVVVSIDAATLPMA